jgi:hypothetical protein
MMRRLEYMALCQLYAMSDRELKDIGLTRSEIASAVEGEGRGREAPPVPSIDRPMASAAGCGEA